MDLAIQDKNEEETRMRGTTSSMEMEKEMEKEILSAQRSMLRQMSQMRRENLLVHIENMIPESIATRSVAGGHVLLL